MPPPSIAFHSRRQREPEKHAGGRELEVLVARRPALLAPQLASARVGQIASENMDGNLRQALG